METKPVLFPGRTFGSVIPGVSEVYWDLSSRSLKYSLNLSLRARYLQNQRLSPSTFKLLSMHFSLFPSVQTHSFIHSFPSSSDVYFSQFHARPGLRPCGHPEKQGSRMWSPHLRGPQPTK